jgi:receptor expression-enhancing protein 5/6
MSAQQVKAHPAVQQVSNQASFYIDQLDKEVGFPYFDTPLSSTHIDLSLQLSKYPALNNLEQRTQVPKAYATLGACGLVTLRK